MVLCFILLFLFFIFLDNFFSHRTMISKHEKSYQIISNKFHLLQYLIPILSDIVKLLRRNDIYDLWNIYLS